MARERWSSVALTLLSLFVSRFPILVVDGCIIGTADPTSFSSEIGNTTDGQTFMIDSPSSTCCGTVTTWMVYANHTGSVTALQWRPTTGFGHELVEKDVLSVTTGLNTIIPSVTFEIQSGDKIGWQTDAEENVMRAPSGSGTTQMQLLGNTDLPTEVPWNQAPEAYTYGFGAVVTENTAPTVATDSQTISVTDISSKVLTLGISDVDNDVTSLTVTMTSSPTTSDLLLNKTATGFDIITGPGPNLAAGTYTLTVEAKDGCNATGTNTVTVIIQDQAPVFSPSTLESSYSPAISDSTTATNVPLYSFEVIDNDPITCWTNNPLFTFTYTAPNHTLWLSASSDSSLHYDANPFYTVTITCGDGTTNITSDYTVFISDEPLVLTGLGTSSSIGDLSPVGSSPITTFTVYDQDDDVNCTVDAPYSSDFAITELVVGPGTQTYQLFTNATLDEDLVNSYTIQVTCYDGQNTDSGTHTLTVTDDLPTILDLPDTASTQGDGQQTTKPIHTITVTDANDLADISCSVQSPNDLLFTIDGTAPNLTVSTIGGTTLEASSAPYLLTIICRDDEPTNLVSSTLTVPLVDTALYVVGTFPALSPDLSDNTVTQTVLANFTISETNVNCSVTDPSPSPYEVVEIIPPANVSHSDFNIQVSASVTQADINYDDASTVTLTIVCTDGPNQITEYFGVVIVDADPNMIGLPGTPYNSVNDSTTSPIPIVSFNVTDSDDTINCEVDPADPSSSVFEVRNDLAPEFWIWLRDSPGLNADVTPSYTVPIQCTDGTTPAIVTESKIINIISAPPEFVDMPFTVNVSDAANTTTLLHTFSVSDTPSSVITCSTGAAAPYENDFTIDDTNAPTFDINLEATNFLDYNTDSSISVPVTCSDGSTNITEILTVQLIDEDPYWRLLPAAGPYQSLNDSHQDAMQLYAFKVVDSDDSIKCDASPADSFEIRNGTVPEFQIWYRGNPTANLDASLTPSVNVTVTCGDGDLYSQSEIYQVDLANGPATFLNLPDGTPSILESETSKYLLYTFEASDTTALDCYLSSPADVPGISLENKVVNLPITAYDVYAESADGFDYDAVTATPGFLTIDISCTDTVTAVTQTLTTTIVNSAPTLDNPGGTFYVPEDDASEMDIKFLDVSAYDENDITCVMTSNDGGPFEMSGTTIVKTATALDYESKSSYSLIVDCTDPLGESFTDYITVLVENEPLTILNLATDGEIREDQVTEYLLQALELSEEALYCYQDGVIEPEFLIKIDPATNDWSVFYVSEAVAGKPLDVQTKSHYELKVVCMDEAGENGTVHRYFINVIPNEPPTFTNLDANQAIEVQAKEVFEGDSVYTITSSDVEDDAVTVNLVDCQTNTTCPFSISGNDIISNGDLHSHPEGYYILTVELEDKYNKNVETRDIIVHIKDINTNPVITNIPTYDLVGFTENNAADDVVFTVDVDDPDIDDELSLTCDFPGGGSEYFYCDPTTLEIRAIAPIDREALTQPEFLVNVTVTDGYNTTVASELLTININHENEQPTFLQDTWTLSIPGEGENGYLVGCPDFYDKIDDEDKYHTFEHFTYTFAECAEGDGVFQMDSESGCITMTREWDLDAVEKRLRSETITCTVNAEDYKGLSTQATIVIEVNDEDDNKPYLDKTSYKFCATVGTTSGTLGTINADDNDVDEPNRDLTIDFPGGGPFGSNGNNGALTYGDLSDYEVGTVFETSVRVTDAAGHSDTSPVTVVICDPPTTTNNNINNNSNTSSSSSSSINDMLLWLIPLLLLGLLLLGGLAFLLFRYCRKGTCGKACRCFRTKPAARKVTVIRREVVPKEKRLVKMQRLVEIRPQPVKVVEEKKPPQTLALMKLPMTRFYARNTANMANADMANQYPMS